MYNELIDALRNCACIKTDASCANCGYARSTECKRRMIEDAADAIERLMDEVEHKETVIQAMLQQSEKQQAEAEKWKQAWATLYDVYANGKGKK